MQYIPSFARETAEARYQEGREEGRTALIKMLSNNLETRFGTLPLWVPVRLDEADIGRLGCWGELANRVSSLDEVFEG